MSMKAIAAALALALTAGPALAAPAPACPATFEAFLRKFTDNKAFQFASTAARIDDLTVEERDDEPVPSTINISKNNLVFPIIQSAAEQKRLGLDMEIRNATGPKPEVKLQQGESDWVVVYKFERRACWVLVAREDWTL
jgi:hypothetical protein